MESTASSISEDIEQILDNCELSDDPDNAVVKPNGSLLSDKLNLTGALLSNVNISNPTDALLLNDNKSSPTHVLPSNDYKFNPTDALPSNDNKLNSNDDKLNSTDSLPSSDDNLNVSDILPLNDPSTKLTVIKTPLNSPVHSAKALTPEVTFELQFSPEIKFNLCESETDYETNCSLNEVEFHNSTKYGTDSPEKVKEKDVEEIKRTTSLDETNSSTIPVIPVLNLNSVISDISDKTDEQIRNIPVLERSSSKSGSNTRKTSPDYCNMENPTLDATDRDGNLMQSLLNSVDTGTTSTEYKALCEEFTARQNLEIHNALIEKDLLIQKLTQTLQESAEVQKELNKEILSLHTEVNNLKKNLAETGTKKSPKESPSTESLEDKDEEKMLQPAHISRMLVNLDIQKFSKDLTPIQKLEFDDIKYKFQIILKQDKDELKQEFDRQIGILQDTAKNEKQELENEISRLRQALCEFKESGSDILQIKEHLQEQHKKEVEDLRTYFEKKCADMEKHYSEEIFSQQSRRVSSDSTLDDDLDLLYNRDIPEKCEEDNVVPFENFEQGAGDASKNIEDVKLEKSQDDSKPSQSLQFLQSVFHENLSKITEKHASQLKTIELRFLYELAELKIKMTKEQNSDGVKKDELIQEIFHQAELQLQQQVETVRWDILNIFEKQIKLLTDKEALSIEMTQMKDQKSEDSQREIINLKTTHQNEIMKLRNDYEKQLNRKLQRNSSFDKNRDLGEVFKERNSLRKVNHTLHLLITELISYVSDCETEINNAFWSKLKKLEELCDTTLPDDSIHNASDLSLILSNDLTPSKSGIRHVHFAPDISQFLEQLKDDSICQNMELEKSVTINLKTELNNCLDRLKSEASALLQLTNTNKTEENNIFRNDLNTSEKLLNLEKLEGSLTNVVELEREKKDIIEKLIEVQKERDELKVQLADAYNKNEIVSEGYGGHSPVRNLLVKQTTFSELRQRATTLLSTPLKDSSDGVNSQLLQLFEDLCREGDRIYEEANCDRDDLQLQIEVADKQLRSTRQFLEDQAAEREQERDDFTREINDLKAKLKAREKERHVHESALKEVEQDVVEIKIENLESQIRELSLTISEDAKRNQKVEAELKASVEKISLLSDIIRELENQLEAKSLNEKYHEKQINDLHIVNEEQHKKYESLTKELLTVQHESDVHTLNEKISSLEDQLLNHRQFTENTAAILEVKRELDDIGACIDIKTKQLEALHAAVYSTSCSSEDVSVGDRKISKTDKKVISNENDAETSINNNPVDILDHLQHIQDKLTRHWRVEEAALKQIRDLEMQIKALKLTYSEIKNERDLFQERCQQQIIDLASLQSRLDDQRRRADSVHKQSTLDLHLQMHDLQNELASTKEQLINKNRRIQNLERIVEESRMNLTSDLSGARDNLGITKLSEEVEELIERNRQLNEKLGSEAMQKDMSDLIDAKLEEKDAEINELKDKLEKTTKELKMYLQLQLSDEEIKKIVMLKEKKDRQNGTKLSARTLSDIVSISDYDELDVMRKDDTRLENTDIHGLIQKPDMNYSPPFTLSNFNLNMQDDIQFCSLSCDKIEKTNDHGSPVLQQKLDLIPENDECSLSEQNNIQMQLRNEIDYLKNMLKDNLEELEHYKQQVNSIPILEEEMKKLQENLQETLQTIDSDKLKFESLIASENQVRKQIQSLQADLIMKSRENNTLEQNLKQKEEELENLVQEKQHLQKMLDELNSMQHKYKNYDQIVDENKTLKDKINDVQALQLSISEKKLQIDALQKDLMEKNQELLTLRDYTELLKQTIKEKSDILNEKNQEIHNYQSKIEAQSNHIEELVYELNNFKYNQDNKSESENIDLYKNELRERNDQILHFKELLDEKDRIIDHMSKDSDNLHTALATVQNKLKESGNILDLAMKLKNELKKNELLGVEVEQLRQTISKYEMNAGMQPIDDIENQVQKELDESIKLDNRLIKVIENDDFIIDDNDQYSANKKITQISAQNDILQLKLSEEIKRNVKLMANKQTQLIEIKNLEDRLKKEEQINRKLHKELQHEMDKNNEIQKQDAAIMEAMRLRLEEALEKDNMNNEKLEKIENISENEDLKSHASADYHYDTSSKKNTHDELLLEAKCLRKDLEKQYEVNDKLSKDILFLKAQIKVERNKLIELHSMIANEREQFNITLDNKNKIIEDLSLDLDNLKEHKHKLARELYETNQRSIQQCSRISTLESRLKSMQLIETQQNQNRRKSKEEDQNASSKHLRLAQTSNLESCLNFLQNELDNVMESESITRKTLNDRNNSVSSENKLKDVNCFMEKHVLDSKNISVNNKREGLEYVSFETYKVVLDKVNHLLSKCMRIESYRKALVWQKEYLIRVQRSYEVAERNAIVQLNMTIKNHQFSPLQKFRNYVLVVIAINRMQYLVKRWDAGKTISGRVSNNSRFYHSRLRERSSGDNLIKKHA